MGAGQGMILAPIRAFTERRQFMASFTHNSYHRHHAKHDGTTMWTVIVVVSVAALIFGAYAAAYYEGLNLNPGSTQVTVTEAID